MTRQATDEKSATRPKFHSGAVLDCMNDAVYVRGLDYTILYINRAAERLTGWRLDEALTRPCYDVFGDPEAKCRRLCPIEACIHKRESFQHQEGKLLRRDGVVLDVRVSSSPLLEDEKVIGAVVVLQDITDLHEIAKTNLKNLMEAMESFPDGFAVYDADDNLTAYNSKFLDGAVKGTADLIRPGVPYEDLLRAAVNRGLFEVPGGDPEAYIHARLAHHRKGEGSLEIRLNDGRWIQSRKHKTPSGGTIGIRTDITDLKNTEQALRRSEEQFRGMLEDSNQGIAIRQGAKLVYTNQAFADLFGYDDADEVLALTSVKRLWAPGEGDRMASISQSRDRDDAAPTFYEFRGQRKDGSLVWLENRAQKITWKGGPAVLSATIDVSQRKATEDQLRQAQKMEAVGQLTGGIAHDFNNLLAATLINAQLLERYLEGRDDLMPIVDDITTTTRLGADLTHRLLAFSRKQPLQPETIQLAALCAGMRSLMKRTLGGNIKIDMTADDDVWNVLADPGQVENAVLNLAINSSHAMPEGGTLTINIENTLVTNRDWAERWLGRPGAYVTVNVSDTGYGMPAHVLEHVFEPFFTTKNFSQGSGLGLSMVYGFAQQSGGFTAIESDEGKGTTVTIYLPKA